MIKNNKMSSTIKATGLLKLIISLFLIINCTSTEVASQSGQAINPFLGTIRVTVDNVLVRITRNGVPLNLAGAGVLNNWTLLKTVKAILRSGDFIAITGINSGPYSVNNPGAMLATITYRDNFGNIRVIRTNNRWRCNYRQARQLGSNGNPNTIWFNNNNGPISGINLNAQWIWSRTVSAPRAICSIRLP